VTEGEPIGIHHPVAHRIVCSLVRGENVELRSTTDQQHGYYDIERTLKPLLVEKITKMMKQVYHKFF
jgi:hypothetical protein